MLPPRAPLALAHFPVGALPAALHTLNSTTVLSLPSAVSSLSKYGTMKTSTPSSLRYLLACATADAFDTARAARANAHL